MTGRTNETNDMNETNDTSTSSLTRPATAAVAPDARKRRVRNVLLAIALPVVLAIAYLVGMSSADASRNEIPALIVNDDQMAEQVGADGTTTNVVAGRLLVSHLTSPDNDYGFDWQLADAQTAADALASGDAHVVLTIPETFSASIVSLGTSEPQQAQLQITTDQAHDYLSAQAARALADAVAANFGTDVTEMVAIGLVQGFEATGEGLQEAADGAGQLASGADQLASGFVTYTDGQQQITDGLGDAATGSQQLATGVGLYVAGVDQFASGASQFASGTSEFAGGVTQYTAGVNQFASGVTQYTAGVDQLAGGIAQLDEGVAPLGAAADQIDAAVGALGGVAGNLPDVQTIYENEVRPGLVSAAADADLLAGMCAELPDPARQEECSAAAGNLTTATSGATTFVDGVVAEVGSLGDATGGLDQLTSLSGGLRELVDGISQLADGAGQLSSASSQLNDGATQLTSASGQLDFGANQLVSASGQIITGADQIQGAGAQLTSGSSELSGGLGLLADGQSQLAAGSEPIQDGLTGIASGAGELQSGLQDGADQASGALGDAESYADVLARPVVANVESQHDPGFGGMLGALAVPLAAWVAAFVTMLARRLFTPEGRDSTASTTSLVRRAFVRLGIPVAASTLGVGFIAHVVGAPWAGLLGTLGLGLLTAAAVTAVHLLFVALWGRRGGAIASFVGLVLQLAALQGVLPIGLQLGWGGALATISPVAHAAAGLQLTYAGGSGVAILTAYVALALITVIGAAAAWLVVERSRRSSLDHLVDLRSAGTPRRAGATT